MLSPFRNPYAPARRERRELRRNNADVVLVPSFAPADMRTVLFHPSPLGPGITDSSSVILASNAAVTWYRVIEDP